MLVDAHALLWFLTGDRKRISKSLQARIEAEATTVSTATLWEIAIKASLEKLDAPDDLPDRIRELGFEFLQVSDEHAWRVRQLPFHHRDPFDRLLIAQSLVERLPVFTADPLFARYGIEVVWG